MYSHSDLSIVNDHVDLDSGNSFSTYNPNS